MRCVLHDRDDCTRDACDDQRARHRVGEALRVWQRPPAVPVYSAGTYAYDGAGYTYRLRDGA